MGDPGLSKGIPSRTGKREELESQVRVIFWGPEKRRGPPLARSEEKVHKSAPLGDDRMWTKLSFLTEGRGKMGWLMGEGGFFLRWETLSHGKC